MSQFQFHVTSPSLSSDGTAWQTNQDLGDPSFWDVYITNSTDPLLANGRYDAYCLNPHIGLAAYDGTTIPANRTYSGDEVAGTSATAVNAMGLPGISQGQLDQINWILAQNFTTDAKYQGQYGYGEVQTAIWHILGYSDAQIAAEGQTDMLSAYRTQVVSASDAQFLQAAAQAAVAAGNLAVPTDTYFSMVMVSTSSTGATAQPLILQLNHAKLGDTVWLDTNANGLQDAGEVGKDGIQVNLLDSAGHVLATTTTGDDLSTAAVEHGFYQFTGLKAGTYQVQFVAPAYAFTTQDDASNSQDSVDSDADAAGLSQLVVLGDAESNQTVDAGLVAIPPKAHIGDFVWEDQNANGVQDAGEAGMGGVTVNLKNSTGTVVATTVTAANGSYGFDVVAGTYSVQVVAPSAYLATAKAQGGNTATDSNIDAAGNTAAVTLAAGQIDNSIDAGLYRTASLGDRVWLDANANGLQDAGEAGVANVTVYLLNAAGTVVSTQTTNASGNYLFTGLAPGAYSVQFVAPTGYTLSSQDAGSNDALDSDANAATGKTAAVTLNSGDSNLTVDAGLFQKAHIGDVVWEDKNANGLQDVGEAGIAGVTVNLKNSAGAIVATTVTAANGSYGFDVAPGTYSVQVVAPTAYLASPKNQGGDTATDSNIDASGNTAAVTLSSGQSDNTIDAGLYRNASIGDKVWLDANGNGVQDAGEAGLANVTVNLINSAGAVVATQATNANGNYLFTGVMPGTYQVQFITPTGYTLTSQDAGSNDALDSDANAATGKTAAVTLNSGDSNLTVDAGLFQKAHIGDVVWEDKNANGLQDAGEAGIAGVTVNLKNSAGAIVATTVTSANGSYGFDVAPGTYSVQVVAPTAYLASPKNQGSNTATDSNIDATGNTAAVTLSSGQSDNTIDAGLYRNASLGDRVWLDANANGLQDAGEAGVANVTVYLLNAAGTVIRAQTTDANGNYLFTGLPPGFYSVQFLVPTGYTLTTQDAGLNLNDATDSDANASSGRTGVITLNSGDNNLSVDAGLVPIPPKAHIGDFVWEDQNANGVQDAGEAGMGGVTVNLKNSTGTVVATTVTAANGSYGFDVVAGTYSVQVVAPSAYLATAKAQGGNTATDSNIDATGNTATVTLAAGQIDNSIDAGLYRTASLGDRVWLDANANGLQDAGEAGVANVTVYLLNAAGTVVSTQTTNASGNYLFTGLAPGAYSVQFVAPTGYTLSSQDAGSNDALDSDANAATGKTAAVTLNSGDSNLTVDAGLVLQKGSLGDLVWNDANQNGIQDAGEAGLANVTVGLGTTTATGNQVIKTTVTDSTGHYLFSNLDAGNYFVTVTAPTGYTLTKQYAGNTASDSNVSAANGYSDWITLAQGENNLTIDAGLYKTPVVAKGSIGDLVWIDANNNGVQDSGEAGAAGVAVSLYNYNTGVTVSTTTDSTGHYLFSNLDAASYAVSFGTLAGYSYAPWHNTSNTATDSDAQANGWSQAFALAQGENNLSIDAGLYKAPVVAKGSVGDLVWIDANNNGVQDSGEAGAAGVSVTLYNYTLGTTQSTSTDSSGHYLFSNLDAGLYVVAFGTLAGYGYAPVHSTANTALDSDALANNGATASFQLAQGENNLSIDAGLYKAPVVAKGSIGDLVWIDANNNGVQDSGEAGAAGVAVSLYNYNTGVTVSTTTDSTGHYLFSNLDAASYAVSFGTLAGYSYAPWHSTSNTATDSDAQANGWSQAFALAQGENKLSIDAGLYKAPVAVDPNTASVNGVLWVDSSNPGTVTTVPSAYGNADGIRQSTDNYYFLDARICLVNDATGQVVRTMMTDQLNLGHYNFTGLTAGTYHVEFQLPPEQLFFASATSTPVYSQAIFKIDEITGNLTARSTFNGGWTYRDQGSNEAYDSDVATVTPTTLTGGSLIARSDSFTLAAGTAKNGVDAGFAYSSSQCPLVIDLAGDGIQTVSNQNATGGFDLLGNGLAITSGWISKGDALLAVDSNHNGRIDDIHELFGGNRAGQGYAQLATYDSNHDGLIDAQDARFGDLILWQDANGNHQTDAGELITLARAGIVALSLDHSNTFTTDAQGNVLGETSAVTLANGHTVAMTDVYFDVSQATVVTPCVVSPRLSELLSDGALDHLVGAAVPPVNQVQSSLMPTPEAQAADPSHGEVAELLRRLAALSHEAAHTALAA